MKNKLFRSCIFAAAMSVFYACSPDEQVVADLDKVSQSEQAMMSDKISFDAGLATRDGAGFVTNVQSDGGASVSVSGFQRFYNDYTNPIYFPANPGQYTAANRANLFNTSNAPIPPSDDIDLAAAANSGNALMVNMNDKANVPDDWAWGATMNVSFASMGTVTLNSMRYLDNEEGVTVNLYGQMNNLLFTTFVGDGFDASNQLIDLGNTAGVARMEVIQGDLSKAQTFGYFGSGAVDDIEFMREVPEDGCTRTQGYWKNHAPGSKKADDAWGTLATTPFFSSGKTYLTIFDVEPRGNSYYSLAHQYVAAKLNLASDATMPASVLTAYNQATQFLTVNTPAVVDASKSLKAEATRLAGILDAYNNGVTGPGHCD